MRLRLFGLQLVPVVKCAREGCENVRPADARPDWVTCSERCRAAKWRADHPVEAARPRERLRTAYAGRLTHTVARVDGQWVVVRWRGEIVERPASRAQARLLAHVLRGGSVD